MSLLSNHRLVLIVIAILCAARCAGPPAHLPAKESPLQRDLSIPRESGPYGFDQRIIADNAGTLGSFDWDRTRAHMDNACREWRRAGRISFGRLWDFLGTPARNPGELLRKAALVRYGIPEFQYGHSDYPGGTAALLISIAFSQQHKWVRRAALAALYGFHLDAGPYGLSASENHHDWSDECPPAMIERNAAENGPILGQLLNAPEAVDLGLDLVLVVRRLTRDGEKLPAYFTELSKDIAGYHGRADRKYAVMHELMLLLAESPDPRAADILSLALLDEGNRDPFTLRALLRIVEKPQRVHQTLRAAVETLNQELKDRESDAEFEDVFKLIRKILKRPARK